MYEEIRFPHLGIVLEHVGKSIDVFGFSIAYYGIIIAAGMMAAMLICTSPVSYTHLDVYKRQVQEGTFRICPTAWSRLF